jgi:1,4-alpha-glucan branching enzyme
MNNKSKEKSEPGAKPNAAPGLKRRHSNDKKRCRVTFWLPKEAAPEARCVAVAGSFNDWSVSSHRMNKLKNGDFSVEIELEAGREHEFRFVIDETRWENAWNADKYVWSEHGNCHNSVIVT